MRTPVALAPCLLVVLSAFIATTWQTSAAWSQNVQFFPPQNPGDAARDFLEGPAPSPTSASPQTSGLLQITEGHQPGDVTLHADRAPLTDVLKLISRKHGLNLVAGPGINGEVTLSLENAHLEEVLDAIVGVTGHRWHRNGNLLYITDLDKEMKLGAAVQGRILRVFPLSYVSASDVQPIAEGLLSPVGQAFISSSDSEDKSKTKELLIVEDIPEAVHRIENYVLQIDHPPRQVLIEVHLLQVVLNDLLRHGVNLKPMARLGNGSITFESLGLANKDATQGMKMSINGNDITGLVELIQSNTNTRTLASPKLLVANRQSSNIQIGKRLSYLTTTTTQTAAVQSVQFLETGVVVQVTPTISDDNQVLLQISPKVSGGQLNAATNLPEEESTELSTTVLLPDGGGVIMGGLIKDEDIDSVSEVPGFCRIPVLGHLFRRREVTTIRTEIIIAMVAHIVPTIDQVRQHELNELQTALPPYATVELRQPFNIAPEHCPAPQIDSAPQLLMPQHPPLPETPEFQLSPQIQPVPISHAIKVPIAEPNSRRLPTIE